VRHVQMDAKTSSMSTLALIAIPRRATTADLVQTVIANDAARRSHQGVTSASTIRRSAANAAEQGSGGVSGGNVIGPLVSAKIPSNRLFWLFIRRAIEEDPVGSQAPPLFLLSDSITKDSMMMNQTLFHELVVKYEEQGAGDAAAQQRLLEDDDGGGDRQDSVRGDPSFGESRRSVTNGAPLRAGIGESTAENESLLFGLPSFLGFSGLGSSFNPKHMHMPQPSSQNSPSIAPRNASMVPAGFGSSGGGIAEDSFALPPSTSSTQYPLAPSAQYTNNSTAHQRLSRTGSPLFRPATMASPPPAALAHQGARGGPTPATSSLLTVTVTASTGQLRTFRASQQFWDHVLLEYHNMLERQMHAAMDVSPRNDRKKKAPTSRQRVSGPHGGSPNRSPQEGDSVRRTFEEEDDELSLLRSAQKEEQDRLVLTVTVNTYDAQRELASQGRWLKQVSGGMHKGHGGGGGGGGLRSSLKKALDSSVMQKQQQHFDNMTSAQMKVSFAGPGGGANGMSPFTDPLELSGGQDYYGDDNDSYSGGGNDAEEAPAAADDQINRVKSVQMFVSEWRQVVDAWDAATAVLLHEEQGGQQHPQTTPAKGKQVAADPLQGFVDQAEMWSTRPRSTAVVDPTTTEDLVRDAMDRMRSLEQQRRSSRLGGGGNGEGSGLYWTHFMNHWKVLEAQYRNYL
jgi:hypothetical protein